MTSFQLYNHRANNKFTVVYGKMTEWSKVCDSSESLPLIRGFSSASAGVGSNPTLVNFFNIFGSALLSTIPLPLITSKSMT